MNLKTTNNYFWLGSALLLLPYLIWFFFGEDSYVLIHDNIDHEFVFLKLLLESGNLWGFDLDGTIPQVMNGIPRSFFRSGFNFTFLIFSIFPAIYAYIFHHLVVHVIGYVGMYLLLKKYFIRDHPLLQVLIALCFGFLPYYHIQYGISISGQPLLLLAFLNLLNDQNEIHNWLIILLFPFFSFLPVTLPFFIPILIILGGVKLYQTSIFPKSFFGGIILIGIVNILVEFNLLYSILFSDMVSHRIEWNPLLRDEGYIFGDHLIATFIEKLVFTHYHTGRLSPLPILACFLFGLLFNIKISKTIKFLFGLLCFIFIWFGLNLELVSALGHQIPFLKTFSSHRFFFMEPFIWLLLLASILKAYDWKIPIQKFLAIGFILLTIGIILLKNPEIRGNVKLVFDTNQEPTFSQFYDKPLFDEIKNIVGKENMESFNFLTIGFFPNIAQYNGLRTLDSYQNNYPLTYKHEFRKIIQGELEKNNKMLRYFDYWGSRCYAFSSELGTNLATINPTKKEILHLDYNFEQIKKMGGKYILSSMKLPKDTAPYLQLMNFFDSKKFYRQVYLYEIK